MDLRRRVQSRRRRKERTICQISGGRRGGGWRRSDLRLPASQSSRCATRSTAPTLCRKRWWNNPWVRGDHGAMASRTSCDVSWHSRMAGCGAGSVGENTPAALAVSLPMSQPSVSIWPSESARVASRYSLPVCCFPPTMRGGAKNQGFAA